MQFATTLTEYILPGLPLALAVGYAFAVLNSRLRLWNVPQGRDDGILVALGAALLGVAYMVGVLAHAHARNALRAQTEAQENKAWTGFGRYAKPLLDALGPCADDEAKRDDKGWILLRMRYFVLRQCNDCGKEIVRLQTIARIARGAIALPAAVVVFATVLPVHILFSITDMHTPSLTRLAVIAAVPLAMTAAWLSCRLVRLYLSPFIERTYRYRWGVLCRASVAAFITCAWEKTHKSTPPQMDPATAFISSGDGSD
jgi:hypothetical protein